MAMVASGRTPHADLACVNACVQRLNDIVRAGGLLIDDLGLILIEYTTNLGHAGQPGAGEKFVKWAFNNQSTLAAVRRVVITQCADQGWRRFNEFPDRAELSGFDKSDQKFVAVALASGENAPILNAVDSDWGDKNELLRASGVVVKFLCPQHVSG